MKKTNVLRKRLFRLASTVSALLSALWLNSVAAHSGHEHGAGYSGWTGRIDDLLLGGGILLAAGVVYWFSNLRGEERTPGRDSSAERPR